MSGKEEERRRKTINERAKPRNSRSPIQSKHCIPYSLRGAPAGFYWLVLIILVPLCDLEFLTRNPVGPSIKPPWCGRLALGRTADSDPRGEKNSAAG